MYVAFLFFLAKGKKEVLIGQIFDLQWTWIVDTDIWISGGDPDLLWKRLTDPCPYLWRTWFYINFHKTFLSVLKNLKLLFSSVVKTDPCLYFFEYSPDVLKKKKNVLDIFNTYKKGFMKINIETSPPEIWIRIRFYNGSDSQSLIWIQRVTKKFMVVILESRKAFVFFFSLHKCSNFVTSFMKV